MKTAFLETVNKLSYVLVGIVAFSAAIVGFQYMKSPDHIRDPQVEHYHYRMQIVVDGELVDFSSEEFQEEYEGGQCSADLPTTPIHFHDKVNQLTHIHWDGIRGGDVLKYYGWNLIGGSDERLGKRFDDKLWGQAVRIHTKALPSIDGDAEFYVYSGDENEYEERELEDFLEQDLEVFFDKESLLNEEEDLLSSLVGLFAKKAYAHDGEDDVHIEGESEEQRLIRINNVIGNVVIFVQDSKPTDEEIAERFNNLEPLQDSTCGG